MAKITKLLEVGVKLHPHLCPPPKSCQQGGWVGEGLARRRVIGEGESGANFRALLSFVS